MKTARVFFFKPCLVPGSMPCTCAAYAACPGNRADCMRCTNFSRKVWSLIWHWLLSNKRCHEQCQTVPIDQACSAEANSGKAQAKANLGITTCLDRNVSNSLFVQEFVFFQGFEGGPQSPEWALGRLNTARHTFNVVSGAFRVSKADTWRKRSHPQSHVNQ